MTTENRRAGFTLDTVTFKQGYLPFVPDKFSTASPASYVGRCLRSRTQILAIAQARHTQNEMVRAAKQTGKPLVAPLPEPDVRVKIARTQQRQLDEIARLAAAVGDETFRARSTLKVHDYEKDGILGALRNQELRAHLRTLDKESHALAMRRHDFRIAALEQPAELSGLAPSIHAELFQETLRAKYPGEIADLDDADEAVQLLQETIKPARAAVEAELLAAGTSVAEPAEPAAPAQAWT